MEALNTHLLFLETQEAENPNPHTCNSKFNSGSAFNVEVQTQRQQKLQKTFRIEFSVQSVDEFLPLEMVFKKIGCTEDRKLV
jgi:hypothetical protein